MARLGKTVRKVLLKFCARVAIYAFEVVSLMISLLFPPKRSQIPPIDDPNLTTSATRLSQQIKSGHITSEEVVESFISRIKKVQPIINAVVDKRFEQALKEARAIDEKLNDARNGDGDTSILKLQLVGVPISVKETVGVDGYSFTGGLRGRRFVKAPKNSVAIQNLVSNGLIPIALTNVPEMSAWWDTTNGLYGRTSNPYDISLIPGGSSGGEAALIASAGSVVGVGSDLGGSIRIPCSFCGIFGHKPTPFVVSNEGMYPQVKGEREKMLGVGPMARYAVDLKPMLKIMAGTKAERLRLDEPVELDSKLRVYYIEDIGDPLAKSCSRDILNAMRRAADYLVDKFHLEQAEKVSFDELKHGVFLWQAEADAKPDGTRMTSGPIRDTSMDPFAELGKKAINKSDYSMNTILAGFLDQFGATAGGSGDRSLNEKAADLRRKFVELTGDYGVLLIPTHPEEAPKHHTTLLKVFNTSYTSSTTVIQAPITQCPLGMSSEGLPIGMQILAAPFNDRLSLAVAEALDKGLGGWQAPCRVDT